VELRTRTGAGVECGPARGGLLEFIDDAGDVTGLVISRKEICGAGGAGFGLLTVLVTAYLTKLVADEINEGKPSGN